MRRCEVIMDSAAIIAVVGTLGGTIISAIVTYVVQQRVAERQRKWALEDEEHQQHRRLEEGRRQLQHDLLERKLKPIEEALGLMANVIDTAEATEFGLPIPIDESAIRSKKLRLTDIHSDAWNAVCITGSEELKQSWKILTGEYWNLQETGVLGFDGAKKAKDAEIAIAKLLDKMRLGV